MEHSEQEKIGLFIKKLREDKGMTQEEFSHLLKTSQSAVARIESGNQKVGGSLMAVLLPIHLKMALSI
jgi:transcriptional regulator with XRE-family HTH domain